MYNLNTIEHDADDSREHDSEICSSTPKPPKPILRLQRRHSTHSIACDKNVSFDLGRNQLHIFPRDEDGFGNNSNSQVVTTSIESVTTNPDKCEPSNLFTTDLSAIEKVNISGQSNTNGAEGTPAIGTMAIVCNLLTPKVDCTDAQRDCSVSEDDEREKGGVKYAHGIDAADSPVQTEAVMISNSDNNDVELNRNEIEIGELNNGANGCNDEGNVDSPVTIDHFESEIGHVSDDSSDDSSDETDEEPVKPPKILWTHAK